MPHFQGKKELIDDRGGIGCQSSRIPATNGATNKALPGIQLSKQQLENVQVIHKIPARFPPWPDIEETFGSETAEMFARLSCNPPLGQPTVVPATQKSVTFRLGLDVHGQNKDDWEVELWHDFDGGEWSGNKFEQVQGSQEIFDVGQLTTEFRRIFLKLAIERPSKGSKSGNKFTIRFRNNGSSDWKWVSDHFGLRDGMLYWQPETSVNTSNTEHQISEFIQGLDPTVKVDKQSAETPDTLLWSLSIPISGASGQNSTLVDNKLGIATDYTRWFATARLYSPWIQPLHGKSPFSVEKDLIQVSFLRQDGLSVVAMGISGMDDTSVLFRSDNEGNVIIKSRNDGEESAHAKVLVAVSTSYDIANAAVFYHTRRMASGASDAELQTEVQKFQENGGIEPKWFEEWYDGFGYCTWNSLGQSLNEQKILDALKSFRDQGITITTLIVDDNWQTLDQMDNQGQKGMVRFEADKTCFPDGLQSTITKIKKENPAIKRVAVWHTMLGYWGAIAPDGELAQKYKTVKASNQAGWEWTCIAPEDIGRFYDDFYSFLATCGVDGVKTDSQNSLDDLRDAPNRRTMIKNYQDAWILAGLRHLGARQIGCGSQCPVIMFHSMIPQNTPRIVVRNSDDFFPTVESSHAWHIFCNAHNSLVMQHLNILPDWDMFQTNHTWARYHAAARCISGGPIYITDYPQQHDKELIDQMTGKTPRGTTVIFRPSRLAKASQVYTGFDEPKLLKIETYHGAAETGTSILGVFNICKFALSEVLTLDDFSGTKNGSYVVRSHVKGKVSFPVRRSDSHSIHIDLDKQGYDILTAYPLITIESSRGTNCVANLGLIGKMSGAAAIVSSEVYPANTGRPRIWTSLKALGTWGVWIDELPQLSISKDLFALMFGKPVPLSCVKVSETDERVLEIDVEKAWKEGDFSQTWSNEVGVELFLP